MATTPQPELPGISPSQTVSAGQTVTPRRRASFSNDLAVAMHHAEALVDGLRGEMIGEIKALTRDVNRITKSLDDVPKLSEINRANRRVIYIIAGLIIAAIALGWTVFGAGISVTGAVADRVISVKEAQRTDAAREQRIERKLDRLLEDRENGQTNRRTLQQAPQSNVVGATP